MLILGYINEVNNEHYLLRLINWLDIPDVQDTAKLMSIANMSSLTAALFQCRRAGRRGFLRR